MGDLEKEKEELELKKRLAQEAKDAAEAPEREAKDAHKSAWEGNMARLVVICFKKGHIPFVMQQKRLKLIPVRKMIIKW